MKKSILLLGFTIGILFTLNAQVTGLKYLIEYNNSTSLYDCKIVIAGGEATNYIHRIQFNTQYTIVAPTGTTLSIEELHNPIENNQFFTGTTPCRWEIGSIEYSPPTQPQHDFYSILPNLSPPSAYDNLSSGDTITIFSLLADLDPCEGEIRTFEKGVDPTSAEMPSGGDFSNGFSLGGGVSIYSGNLSSNFESYISPNDSLSICINDCVSLEPTILCQPESLNYEWSTGETTETIEVCPTEPTNYYLFIKDLNDIILDSIPVSVGFQLIKNTDDIEVCAGSTISLESCQASGDWTQASGNPVGASLFSLSGGIVEITFSEMAIGTFDFIYSIDGLSETIQITVLPKLLVDISSSNICVGQTTTATSNMPGGTWVSNNIAIAVVNSNTGKITPIGPGAVTFTYTSPNLGCTGTTLPLTITLDISAEFIGPDSICIGETTNVVPEGVGSWSSNFPTIASITDSGMVTGLQPGNSTLVFTRSTDGCQSNELVVNIQAPTTELIGPNSICIGETTSFSTESPGTWVSSDPSIATITSATGVVTGVGTGTVTFVFTESETLCQSLPTETVKVSTINFIEIEDEVLCPGETTQLHTDAEGTWASDNPAIASVHFVTGLVTAIDEGSVTFTFTTFAGCSKSSAPLTLNVLTKINVQLTGPQTICVDGTTSVSPITGGTWSTNSPVIATIDNNGIVTGIIEGTAALRFTDEITGCVSEAIEIMIIDSNTLPDASNNGPICEGEDLYLTTTSIFGAEYEWYSPTGTIISNEQNPILSNVTPSDVGTYCVVVSIDGCESEEGCTDVLVLHTPSIPVANTNSPVCEGDDLGFATDAVINATYAWTGPNGFSSSDQSPVIINATPSSSGSYCVIVTIDGCPSSEGCTDVIVNPTPATPIASYNGPLCEGEDLELSANAVTGATYTWTGPNGLTSSQQNLTVTSITPADAGSYCVFVTVDGCESEESCIDILIYPTPSTPPVASNSPICEGEDLELWTDFVVGATYQWTSPTGIIYTDQNPIITGSAQHPGIYSLVISIDGCESEIATTEVEIIPSGGELIISNNTPVCIGETVILSVDEIEGATYLWSGPGSEFATGSAISFVAGDWSEGTYEVIRTDEFGCSSSNTTDVQYSLTLEITVEKETICIGESTPIFPISGGSYSLSNDDIGIISGGVFVGLNKGSTDLIYTLDETGCESMPKTITVINCIEAEIACDEIDAEDIMCDYNDLVNFQGTLSSENSGGNQPFGALCDDGDEAHNIAWLGFVALEGDYGIIINTTNCTPLLNGELGVQVGVYSDCNFSEETKIFCENSLQSENQIRIASNMLTPGQTYFLYIDGFDGSICDYSIDVEGFYDNTYCTDLSKVTGVAYIDDNENGLYEIGETLLRNALISLSPGNFSVLTNDEGKYIINTPKGGATLTAKMNEGHWVNNELTIADLTIFETCVEGIDFGFVPNLFYQEANISVTNSVTRCDWETRFYFTVENTGTIDLDAKFEFEFDDKADYFATNLMGLQINGKVASGNLGIIGPFEIREYWIKLKMPSGSSVLPTLDFKTTLFNSGGIEMDSYEQSEQLRCSYDPNDKREYPNREGEENLTLMDEDIEYTIRFQNNGNDTAFLVRIIDPLDPNIDPTSIRVINSSHSVETCIENENLIFLFENINLVDSMTNYDGSQGYVSFRCNTKEGRAENTIVNNTADIIFDTNLPIVTNTTINTLVSELCTNINTEVDIEICDGDNYNGYEESGTYTEIFPLLYGCDSMVVIHLNVQGITYSAQEIEICEGGAFEVNGNEYILYESQEILDTVENALGCISNIFIFDIQVNPILHINIDTTICDGLEYDGLTESGVYTIDSFDLNTGCDIITTIDLVVLPMSDPACIVAVDDLLETGITVYPNPALNRFFVEGKSSIETVSIYSMAYQKVEEIMIANDSYKIQISTENLNRGLYIIAVKSEGRFIYEKLIIE